LDKISLVKQMRLTSIRFSVSLSLLHGLSKWMRLIYFSLWMIRLDELIKVKSLKSLLKKVIQDEG